MVGTQGEGSTCCRPSTCVQVRPPSVDLITPRLLEVRFRKATYKFPLLSITKSWTYSKPEVEGIWLHVVPPSVLLKIPAPLTASKLNHPSPVPAYMVFRLFLSWTNTVTARLAMWSSTTDQPGVAERKLVVLKIPPLTDPAKTVLPEGSFLSIIIALLLPPILLGPRSDQVRLFTCAVRWLSINLIAARSLSVGTMFNAGSLVIKNCCRIAFCIPSISSFSSRSDAECLQLIMTPEKNKQVSE